MSTSSAQPENVNESSLVPETNPPSQPFHPTAPPGSGESTCQLQLQAGLRPLPDYELVRKLGEGGFGEVWHARGPGGLDVALKFIRLDRSSGTLEVRALEVMKTIRHPNLVSLFGAWKSDNVLILAMELCDRSLFDRLKETLQQEPPGIPLDELLGYMRDAARGIDLINGQHIQHRDVKPMNLLLLSNGVKLADFGLAKVLELTAGSNTGTMTAAYAAPECFKGEITKHTDQYSLAATYFHLRMGRPVFGGSPGQVMFGHVYDQPDLTNLPEAERAVVAKALSKSSAERWPSCEAFVNALVAACHGVAPKSQPANTPRRVSVPTMRPPGVPMKRRRRGSLIALLFAVLVLCGGLSALIFWPQLAALLSPPGKVQENEAVVLKVSSSELPEFESGRPLDTAPDTATERPRSSAPDLNAKPLAKTYENALGMKFVWIEPGTFQMGSPKDEKGRNDDEKQHRVTLTKGFYMAVSPVTQKQWRAVMNDNPSNFKGDDLPVENITWQEAQEFCKKLRAREERAYRLPTEAEWEYACRAGTQTVYFFGDDAKQLEDHAWFDGNSKKQTHPVGTKKANPWGLYDMTGNVWQWCEDWYGPYDDLPEKDPLQTVKDAEDRHVLRGGSWDGNAIYCRAAYRSTVSPTNHEDDVGIRLVFRPD